MRVLLYVFGTRGGIGQYTAQFANGLSCHVETHVFCPDTPEADALYDDRVTLHRYRKPEADGARGIAGKLGVLAALRRTTAAVEPDVLHLPFADSPGAWPVTVYLASRPEPLVGTVHDPVTHSGTAVDVAGFDLSTAGTATLARWFDAVVVHGQACAEQARAAGYPMDAVHTVEHGMNEHVRDVLHSVPDTEARTMLFFGQVRANKGYDRIPSILDMVERDVPDPTALVAGSIPSTPTADRAELDAVVDGLRRDDRVELHDRYIPTEEVGEFFCRASVVVLPYWDATSSGVAMIAYAFAKPMVATRTGHLGELIARDGSGILAAPDSDREIADGIVELFRNEAKAAEIRENIRAVRDDYRFETIAEDVVAIYRSLR